MITRHTCTQSNVIRRNFTDDRSKAKDRNLERSPNPLSNQSGIEPSKFYNVIATCCAIQSLRWIVDFCRQRSTGKWFQLIRLWLQQRSSIHNRQCSTSYAISIRFIVLGEARARLIPEQNTRRV